MVKKSWVHEVENIARILHLPPPSLEHLYDLEAAEAAIVKYSQNGWWNAALGKPKLRTYIVFKNISEPDNLVKSNLKRYIRSLLAKLVSGIMPLEIETGRYTGTKLELRLCRVCNLDYIEDECHFLFTCIAYQLERSSFYLQHIADIGDFMLKTDIEKIAWLLLPDNIKYSGEFVESLYRKRREIIYKVN